MMHRSGRQVCRCLYYSSRSYATQSGKALPAIFNRQVKQLQRSRAALSEQSRETDYLRDTVADKLVDRLLFLKRDLPHLVDLGGGNGHVLRALARVPGVDGEDLRSRIGRYTLTDLSQQQLSRDDDATLRAGLSPSGTLDRIYSDEESLPFEEGSLDGVVSNLTLHWVNDLPGTLAQIRRCLKPDAPFLAAMLGGDTLFELRTSLQLADLDRRGGLSPRVSPMASVRDVGSLLGAAGFKLTTIDSEDIVVGYPDMLALVRDIANMGEANAAIAREKSAIPRDVLAAASAIYTQLHGDTTAAASDAGGVGGSDGVVEEAPGAGGVPATFNVIYMIGWAPGSSQPTPLARGSGQASLKDTLQQGLSPADLGKKSGGKK